MTPERWKQIDVLAQSALERGVAERAAYLEEACAGDESLRREVESQIAYQQQVSKFVEEPAFVFHYDIVTATYLPVGTSGHSASSLVTFS